MEEQRVSIHPRIKAPQPTYALSMRKKVFRVDEKSPAVPKGVVHVDGKEQATAEVGGRHVEGVMLDPAMDPEEEESSFADDRSNDAIDTSRILGMGDDVDIVANPIGEILLVPKDKPPDPVVIERAEKGPEEWCDPVLFVGHHCVDSDGLAHPVASSRLGDLMHL